MVDNQWVTDQLDHPDPGDVDLRPNFVKVFVDDIHYLHYGAILFIVTGIVTIIISLMTEPIPDEKIVRLTFWTRPEMKTGISEILLAQPLLFTI